MPHYELAGKGKHTGGCGYHRCTAQGSLRKSRTPAQGAFFQIHLGAMVLIYLGPNFAAFPLDAAPGWYLALRRQPERQTCLLISAAQHGR
jgi:hypothetical protein